MSRLRSDPSFLVTALTAIIAGLGFATAAAQPGMTYESFEAAAAAVGSTLECRPLAIEPVTAGRLCHSPDTATSMVRVAGTVQGGAVPYVVVREAITSPAAYDRLEREWGSPDTAIGTARRWTNGPWMANADTGTRIAGGRHDDHPGILGAV